MIWFSVIALSLIVVTVAGWCLYILPKRQTRLLPTDKLFERFQAENEARRTLATLLAGLITVGISTGVGSYFTWRAAKGAEYKTLAENYKTGIEHLGSSDTTYEVSGVYLLEEVTRTDSGSDYAKIVPRVLASFARSKASRKTPIERELELKMLISVVRAIGAPEDTGKELISTAARAGMEARENRYRTCESILPLSERAPAMQVILEVMARNPQWFNARTGEVSTLSLRKTDFSRSDLPKGYVLPVLDFSDSDFSCSLLAGAVLRKQRLMGARFRSANLESAILEGADLTWATLVGANLRNTKLRNALLEDAWLQEADLRGADLRGANLARAHLRDAKLDGACLDGADISKALLNEQALKATYMDAKTNTGEFKRSALGPCRPTQTSTGQ